MQMIIKLTEDKPPRIGVVYATEFQASKAFEALREKYRNDIFKLIIEPAGDRVNLTLESLTGSGKVSFKGLAFKADQLKRFQQYVSMDSVIDFVPVYWKENKLYVAKVRFRNVEPIEIHEYEIVA
jgi:hypothetical protein